MKRYMGMLVAGLAAAITFGTPTYAANFVLSYTGTETGGGSFTTVLDLDLAANGTVATFESGTRNGVVVTGLSHYAGADNVLSTSDPYVDFGGLSFSIGDGETFNFYKNKGAYYEANSITDPHGHTPYINPVSFASVNGVPLATAVPETTTWAMMIMGFGVLGGIMRLAHGKPERMFSKHIRALAAG